MENIYYMLLDSGQKEFNPNIDGLTVEFHGDDSLVQISEGCIFSNTKIVLSQGSKVTIKKTSAFGIRNCFIDAGPAGSRSTVYIDEGAQIVSARFFMRGEDDLYIYIGKNFLASSDVVFRASDGHQIYDVNSLRVFNRSNPIVIEDNVWIGSGAKILKGSVIKTGSIVGTGAVVAGKFKESNVVIAGNPGKIVKHNCTWNKDNLVSREELDSYELENNYVIPLAENQVLNCWKGFTNHDVNPFHLKRGCDPETPEHVKFCLKHDLNRFNYFVFDVTSTSTTRFSIFLWNETRIVQHIGQFNLSAHVRRNIVYPYKPCQDKLFYLSLSSSHFPADTNLCINDFRVI